MRYAIIRSLLLLVLWFSGCDSPWRSRFPIGTELYDISNHRYFGKVVGYENRHDFKNGTEAGPAILIEPGRRRHARKNLGQLRDLCGVVRRAYAPGPLKRFAPVLARQARTRRLAVRRQRAASFAERPPLILPVFMADDPNAIQTDELKARVGQLRRYL